MTGVDASLASDKSVRAGQGVPWGTAASTRPPTADFVLHARPRCLPRAPEGQCRDRNSPTLVTRFSPPLAPLAVAQGWTHRRSVRTNRAPSRGRMRTIVQRCEQYWVEPTVRSASTPRADRKGMARSALPICRQSMTLRPHSWMLTIIVPICLSHRPQRRMFLRFPLQISLDHLSTGRLRL